MGQDMSMVFGSHLVLFSTDVDADRSFFSEVLGFSSVGAAGGWSIFALPPAEAAFHPAEAPGVQMYLMVDNLQAQIRILSERDVACSEVEEAPWGSVTTIRLPGGGELGIYQPRHALAIERSD